jgi:predicted  nucleic acid-binding Zn-ribbon protein
MELKRDLKIERHKLKDKKTEAINQLQQCSFEMEKLKKEQQRLSDEINNINGLLLLNDDHLDYELTQIEKYEAEDKKAYEKVNRYPFEYRLNSISKHS